MRAIGQILDRLAPKMATLTDSLGTDSFFVLRKGEKTSDGRGGVRAPWEETTEEALSCFCAVIPALNSPDLERIAAERKVAVVFRRIVCASSVDCTTQDRVKIAARGATPELDELEVVRSRPLSGLVREIVTVEEQKVAS